MYQDYWNLTRSPFASDHDVDWYSPATSHAAAVLKLQYLIEEGKGAGVLAAETGLGKTYVTHVLESRLDPARYAVVRILYPRLDTAGFLAQLAVRLGVPVEHVDQQRDHVDKLLKSVVDQLREMTAAGQHAVLVIDDAHLIDSTEIWHCLRLLLNFQQPAECQFTLLLVGQAQLLGQLQSYGDLYDRLAVRVGLVPLVQDEVEQFIARRMSNAGTEAHVFVPDAIAALTELSEGNPRRLNQLADLTLLVGYADRLDHITAAEMHAAYDEMRVASID